MNSTNVPEEHKDITTKINSLDDIFSQMQEIQKHAISSGNDKSETNNNNTTDASDNKQNSNPNSNNIEPKLSLPSSQPKPQQIPKGNKETISISNTKPKTNNSVRSWFTRDGRKFNYCSQAEENKFVKEHFEALKKKQCKIFFI